MPNLEPLSPEWWVVRLSKKLRDREKRLQRYNDYYEGKHPLAFASAKFKRAFGALFSEFADNWCDIVVDAVEERLNIQGFRFSEDPDADEDATRIWQANNLDAESQLGHTEALIKEEASVIVWAGDNDKTPAITVEDPLQVIVEHEPGNRRRRAAALKVFTDDWTGKKMATLYLPDAIFKFERSARRGGTGGPWSPREVSSEEWPLDNPLGLVPVVPLVNRPRLDGCGRSEIRSVLPINDGVNKLVADMFVASEYGAYKQRWVTGMEIPTDPETGEPVEPFKHAIDRLFMDDDPNTKFGEFSATDLQNFVVGIEMLIQHIASQTRTPPHYFYLKGQFPSGESIKSAETGLVAKAHRKQRHFGEGWEEVMRISFAVLGDKRADDTGAETIWADPESRTESEHVDAVTKKKGLIPRRQLQEDLGYSPQQIARFVEMEKDEPSGLLGPDGLALPRFQPVPV